MHSLYTLTKSSIKMLLRNKQALFFTLFFPMIIMVIFSFVGFDKTPQFDVGFVTGLSQPQTKIFVDKMKEVPLFKVHEGTLTDELVQLKDGKRAVVLDIPVDFIGTVASQPKELKAYINESQGAQAQTIITILNQYLDKTSLALVHAPTYFSVKQEVVNSKNLKYIDFLLPGLIAMSIMQMSVLSVAFVFVQYKEKGVLKRLLATPMRPEVFVSAQVLTRLIISVVQAVIFVAVGVLLLKAHVIGAYWLVVLCVTLGSLMFLGLGFTVSGLSKTVDTVPVMANLVVFPMMFLGGIFFDISGMPHWLQVISKALPLTHFSSALRSVMTQGSGFGDIKWDLLAMLIWSVLLIGLAVLTFSFQEKESA